MTTPMVSSVNASRGSRWSACGGGFECFARAVERDQAATAMGEVLGLLRCDRDRAVDDLESLAEIAMLGREHAEQEQRVRVVRLSSENL